VCCMCDSPGGAAVDSRAFSAGDKAAGDAQALCRVRAGAHGGTRTRPERVH